MTRRPFSGRGLRCATIPALDVIKFHPINVDLWSYHKPDDDDRIRFGESVGLRKKIIEAAVSEG